MEFVQCSNCEQPAKYRGLKLCAKCYQRLRRNGDFDLHNGPGVCCVNGCEKPVRAYGWCDMHWRRVELHGSPDDRKWSHRYEDRCSVPGCGGEHRSMGLCEKHYTREMRNGHPLWRTLLREKVHGDRPWTESTVIDPSKIVP